MAELDELALHAPVPPGRVVRRDADHELADRGCRGRPPGTPPVRVIPFACDQAPMPGQQRRRGHREHLTPPAPRDQPGQCREPQPIGRLVADPADLAAQHRVLVPEHQEFGVLGHLTPGQHHQKAEQAAREQVHDREDHSAMIPTHKTAQARSSNRALQASSPSQPGPGAAAPAVPHVVVSRVRTADGSRRDRGGLPGSRAVRPAQRQPGSRPPVRGAAARRARHHRGRTAAPARRLQRRLPAELTFRGLRAGRARDPRAAHGPGQPGDRPFAATPASGPGAQVCPCPASPSTASGRT